MASDVIKSAKRVFEVLEAFRASRRPMRLKEMVEVLGYPVSSTAVLLKTMTELSYLTFDRSSHTYLPTSRVSQLGDWISATTYEQGQVATAMRTLKRRTGETILLGTPDGMHVELLEVLRSEQAIQYFTRVGSRVLQVRSGIGWPILAAMPDQAIGIIYARSVAQQPRGTRLHSLKELMEGIAAVRQTGYCFSRGMVNPLVGVVGMLVPTLPDSRQLAIAIAGPLERVEQNLKPIVAGLSEQMKHLRATLRLEARS